MSTKFHTSRGQLHEKKINASFSNMLSNFGEVFLRTGTNHLHKEQILTTMSNRMSATVLQGGHSEECLKGTAVRAAYVSFFEE